jgi:rhodanese-related sulfurtransferase
VSHPRISPAEAAQLVNDQGYAYLDVRSEREFAIEHAAGAYNVPIEHAAPGGRAPNPDFLAVVSAAFGRDRGLVVGCQSGARSKRAAEQLVQAGFSCVVEQRAGHGGTRDAFGRPAEAGWKAAGLPCASTPEPGHDYAALRAAAKPA